MDQVARMNTLESRTSTTWLRTSAQSGADPVVACATRHKPGIQGVALIEHLPLFATIQDGDATPRLQQRKNALDQRMSPDTELLTQQSPPRNSCAPCGNASFPSAARDTQEISLRRIPALLERRQSKPLASDSSCKTGSATAANLVNSERPAPTESAIRLKLGELDTVSRSCFVLLILTRALGAAPNIAAYRLSLSRYAIALEGRRAPAVRTRSRRLVL